MPKSKGRQVKRRSSPPPRAVARTTPASVAETQQATTPGAGPVRTAVERSVGLALVRMGRAGRWLLLVPAVMLLAVAMLSHGVGAGLAMGALTCLVGLLVYLSWPAISGTGRVVRATILAVGVLATYYRFVGR